jgi:hypothetical protein
VREAVENDAEKVLVTVRRDRAVKYLTISTGGGEQQ